MNSKIFVIISKIGPNFMVLLSVSKEVALAEARNAVLLSSIFYGLQVAGNFGLCFC